MDRISGLQDDLLIKMLSFLETKDAVSTSILSKRWKFLWMWLPKLDYSCSSLSEFKKLRCFLDRTLPLHRAPVIESLRIDLDYRRICTNEDIKLWVEVAVSRHLRELDIQFIGDNKNVLPSSLYSCKSLVILKLAEVIGLDVPPVACLPSLKTLQLDMLRELKGESLRRLLSICPVLENLSVELWYGDRSQKVTISVPSLQSLSVNIGYELKTEIDTPCLKYLKYVDFNRDSCYIQNMPKLEEAYVEVMLHNIDSLMGSITSVKHLTLCCPKAVYSKNFDFKRLEHLRLCDCRDLWGNFLAWFLKNSPNLRVLDIFPMMCHGRNEIVGWNEPSAVPECLLSSLQTFSWSEYWAKPEDRDVVGYILQNARQLKTARITFIYRISEKSQIIKELSSYSRASTTCQLVFD